MSSENLEIFRLLVIARKANQLNNLSESSTRNPLSATEVYDAARDPSHIDDIEFYFNNPVFHRQDFIEVMSILANYLPDQPTTDNGYDLLIQSLDKALNALQTGGEEK